MKNILLGFLLMSTLLSVSGVEAQPLRIMSYNIRAGKGLDNVFKPERTLEAIKKIAPDLGGLNEVDSYAERTNFTDTADLLRRHLGISAIFAQALPLKNRDNAPGGYGVLALGKKPLLVMEQFALPLPSELEPRTALIVRTMESDPVYLIVTHLPWEEGPEFDQLRVRCLALIEEKVKANNYTPAILTGDLNATPDSPPVNALRRSWTVCNDRNPQPTFPADKPKIQIDYIAFYPQNAFELLGCDVPVEPAASDHRPLVAELRRVENRENK